MLKLIGAEFFKLRKRWLPYILLLVLLVPTLTPVVINYSNYSSAVNKYPELKDITMEQSSGSDGSTVVITRKPGETYTPPSSEDREKERLARQIGYWKQSLLLPGAMDNIFGILPMLGTFLVIFLASSIVGTEYGWGTLRQILAKGTSRNNYLTSKLLTIAIAVTGGITAVVLTGFLATLITSSLVGGGIEWGGFAAYFFGSLGRTLLVLGVYASMAACFAVLLRSSAAGASVVIAWYIGEPIIGALLSVSTGWLAELPQYFISHSVNNLSAMNALSSFADPDPRWQSCVILLIYITVFVTAAYYALRRQDLPA